MAMNSMMLAQLMKDMQVGLTLKGTHTHDSDIWLCRRRPSSNVYFKGTLSKEATCHLISNDFIVSSNSSIINICVVYNRQYKTSKKLTILSFAYFFLCPIKFPLIWYHTYDTAARHHEFTSSPSSSDTLLLILISILILILILILIQNKWTNNK